MKDKDRSRALTRQEFDIVMKRATELASSDSSESDGRLDEAEVFRIAREVGIPDSHVQRALVEMRSADVPVTVVDRWYGNANVCVSRLVPGRREEIMETADEFFVAGHLLKALRKSEEVLVYRPAVDWLSNFARAGASMSGSVYWASAKQITVHLQQVDEEQVLVEFDVEPGIRGEFLAGGVIGGLVAGGGAGFGMGALLSVLAVSPFFLISSTVAIAGAVAGGVAWGTGRAARQRRAIVGQELEGLLDTLERGDALNPPPSSWRRWAKRQADRFKVELFGRGLDT